MPLLPLEVFTRTDTGARPLVVGEGVQVPRVLLADAAAQAKGILPGMALATAHTLAADLVAPARDERAEQRALIAVADWAFQFSSQIVLYPPCALVLEIQGSLKLFGGFAALLEQVRAGIRLLEYSVRMASAPTPLAAVCLSRCGREQHVETLQALPAVLAPLPLSVLDRDDNLLERLAGMGVQRLGELVRLPRDGLARRFGKALLVYLDRLFGRITDPQVYYRPPAHFEQAVQPVAEIHHSEALLFVMQRLVQMLCGWLRGQGMGVQSIEILLQHRDDRMTSMVLGVRSPTRDTQQLMILLRERFESTQLAEPVLEVVLKSRLVQPFAESSSDLFTSRDTPQDVDLLDRLRARLGEDSVTGLSGVAEHRPEYAWRYSEPGDKASVGFDSLRPLWLLPVPCRLQVHNGRPRLQGELQLQPGRERIQSGWWDGNDVTRDYFIATNKSGACYWVYRELSGDRGWFLHGIFE